MSARFAAALTMCQMAFGVRPAPHIFPSLPTRRKSAPVLIVPLENLEISERMEVIFPS